MYCTSFPTYKISESARMFASDGQITQTLHRVSLLSELR